MRLEHVGNAKVTTSTAEIDGAALVIPLADASNWPTGTVGPFWVSANKTLPNEEKILCSGRSGNSLQVFSDASGNGRGGDGTVPQTHPANSTFEHIWTAVEADAANAHIESTDGAHGMPAVANVMTLSGNQAATGAKQFVKAVVTGEQAEAEFRVRNVYIGSGVPSDAMGNDGDMYISKE